MNVIELRQLTRRYGSRIGVESISLTVPAGTVYGFIGPNGSGKSTTIRVLLGLLKPTSGTAAVFNRDCWRHDAEIKADVGYLPGDLRIYSWMSGHDALRFVSLARGRDLRKQGQQLAEMFELDLSVRVRSMSRGMRQKIGLILAMAHEPKLLILDEPTATLDPIMQERMYAHLRDLAQRGHTVFFSSHTLSEVERLCDRVAILREGRLIAEDSISAMRQRAKREIVITWRDASAALAVPPQFLHLRETNGPRWTASLVGSIDELIRWLASSPPLDVSIGPPDLETLFRDYYRSAVQS